jgi:hypothetical protein
MDILGYVFLAFIALGVLVALIFFIVALPDLARYRRIRRM